MATNRNIWKNGCEKAFKTLQSQWNNNLNVEFFCNHNYRMNFKFSTHYFDEMMSNEDDTFHWWLICPEIFFDTFNIVMNPKTYHISYTHDKWYVGKVSWKQYGMSIHITFYELFFPSFGVGFTFIKVETNRKQCKY